MRTPSDLQAAQDGDAAREIIDQHPLGDFKLQACRRKAGFEQHRMNQSHEVAVAELNRRQIDRDLQRLRPRGRFAAGFAEHPFADLHDQAALLGDWNEGRGRNHAALRIVTSAPAPRIRLSCRRSSLAADRKDGTRCGRWRTQAHAGWCAARAADYPSRPRRSVSCRDRRSWRGRVPHRHC